MRGPAAAGEEQAEVPHPAALPGGLPAGEDAPFAQALNRDAREAELLQERLVLRDAAREAAAAAAGSPPRPPPGAGRLPNLPPGRRPENQHKNNPPARAVLQNASVLLRAGSLTSLLQPLGRSTPAPSLSGAASDSQLSYSLSAPVPALELGALKKKKKRPARPPPAPPPGGYSEDHPLAGGAERPPMPPLSLERTSGRGPASSAAGEDAGGLGPAAEATSQRALIMRLEKELLVTRRRAAMDLEARDREMGGLHAQLDALKQARARALGRKRGRMGGLAYGRLTKKQKNPTQVVEIQAHKLRENARAVEDVKRSEARAVFLILGSFGSVYCRWRSEAPPMRTLTHPTTFSPSSMCL